MPSKTALLRQLQQVKYMSPTNREMLREAVEKCEEDQLDMLAAVIDRSDQAAKKIQQASQERRIMLLEQMLEDLY